MPLSSNAKLILTACVAFIVLYLFMFNNNPEAPPRGQHDALREVQLLKGQLQNVTEDYSSLERQLQAAKAELEEKKADLEETQTDLEAKKAEVEVLQNEKLRIADEAKKKEGDGAAAAKELVQLLEEKTKLQEQLLALEREKQDWLAKLQSQPGAPPPASSGAGPGPTTDPPGADNETFTYAWEAYTGPKLKAFAALPEQLQKDCLNSSAMVSYDTPYCRKWGCKNGMQSAIVRQWACVRKWREENNGFRKVQCPAKGEEIVVNFPISNYYMGRITKQVGGIEGWMPYMKGCSEKCTLRWEEPKPEHHIELFGSAYEDLVNYTGYPNQIVAFLNQEAGFVGHDPVNLDRADILISWSPFADIWMTVAEDPRWHWFEMPTEEKLAAVRNGSLAYSCLFISGNCHPGDEKRPMWKYPELWNRYRYTEQLMQRLRVDSYGLCLHNKDLNATKYPTPEDRPGWAGGTGQKERICGDYPFFLSFENHVIEDYTTEKFFEAFSMGAIPIYLGDPSIERYMPGPHSIINAHNFPEPGQLADYMQYLVNNSTAYMEYFAWRKDDPKKPTVPEDSMFSRAFHGWRKAYGDDFWGCAACNFYRKNYCANSATDDDDDADDDDARR